jgi:hypothetical protein
LRAQSGRFARYKTGSVHKCLICKGFCSYPFFAAERQALDFSGRATLRRQDVNKVIHKYDVQAVKENEIKDLGDLPEVMSKL